jgi:hypothetical protein
MLRAMLSPGISEIGLANLKRTSLRGPRVLDSDDIDARLASYHNHKLRPEFGLVNVLMMTSPSIIHHCIDDTPFCSGFSYANSKTHNPQFPVLEGAIERQTLNTMLETESGKPRRYDVRQLWQHSSK